MGADARSAFDREIEKTSDPDEIARLEVAREYFTDPELRKKLEDSTFRATYKKRRKRAKTKVVDSAPRQGDVFERWIAGGNVADIT